MDLGKIMQNGLLILKRKFENDHNKIVPFAYRPFDNRYTYFDNNLVWRTRTDVMQHFNNGKNVGLVIYETGNG